MSMETVLEKLAADPAYADKLQANPEAALRAAGVDPTPELVAALKEGGTSQELAARVSKAYRSGR